MSIKMFVTDLDGTFLYDDKKYNKKYFFKLLKTLKEKNVQFVAASGNQLLHMKKYIFEDAEEKGFNLGYVAYNGAVASFENKNIDAELLSPSQVEKVVKWNSTNKENLIVLNGLKNTYVTNHANQKEIDYLNSFFHNIKQVEKISEIDDQFLEITFVWHENDKQIQERVDHLKEIFGDELHSTGSGFGTIDILPKGVNKSTALEKLQNFWNIKDDEVVVFGDNQNDLEMLNKYSKYNHSYVMPNAQKFMHEQIKQQALDTNNNDGVLKTIEELINLGEV